MIVRRAEDGVQLITQADHAHLAGRIMEHCVPLAGHPRRGSILHAIAEHDNGWAEEDALPTVDPRTWTVTDFVSAPLAMRHRVWPRGIARLADDPWAAALVAHHAATVYDRFRPEAEWASFFEGMEASRDAMRQTSGLPHDQLLADYVWVRLADLISLTFCAGWADRQTFEDWVIQLNGATVTIRPDPFGGVPVPIQVQARQPGPEPFRSDAELREALQRASTVQLTGEVRGT